MGSQHGGKSDLCVRPYRHFAISLRPIVAVLTIKSSIPLSPFPWVGVRGGVKSMIPLHRRTRACSALAAKGYAPRRKERLVEPRALFRENEEPVPEAKPITEVRSKCGCRPAAARFVLAASRTPTTAGIPYSRRPRRDVLTHRPLPESARGRL